MTDKKDCMTMEQAEQKMECLREVFSIVRLVDGEMLEKRAEHSADADAMEMCQCYSFWNKAKPCENCISMKSLREKKQAAKLEFLDSDIFQVFSRYFALGIKAVCLILGALGIANMWMAIFADVGVMVIAVLNAIRALFVKHL